MKNKIEYYYDLNVDQIKKNNSNYIFMCKNDVYIFKKVNFNKDNLAYFFELNRINNIDYLLPVLNRNKEFVTIISEQSYVLLKSANDNYNIYDEFRYYRLEESNPYYTYKIWEEKMDYCRSQLLNFFVNNENKVLINLFNYYSGISENAISILEKYEKNIFQEKKYLSRMRIFYPNNTINYYDPTEYLIDYKSRDYAEYLKSQHVKGKTIDLKKVVLNLKKYDFNNDDIIIFFSRLMYPTYFFDIFEKIIDGRNCDDEINTIIINLHSYEQFLKDVYMAILDITNNMPKIDWIMNV